MSNKKPYKSSLQLKIAGYFILLVIIIINSVGWFLYFRAKAHFDEELGSKLVSVAEYTAESVESDLLSYLSPGDENGEFYQSVVDHLITLKESFNINRIYIVDSQFSILVDTQKGTLIGSTIAYLQSHLAELNTSLQGIPQFSTLYRGTDGNLYKSAFAPVKISANRITAIACVDASPTFLQVIDRIKGSIIFINTISLFVAIIMSIFLARSIVDPVKKLVIAARRMSGGDFSRQVFITSQNEIGYLGDVFNSMQQNIQINQEKLEELKKIAETKADRLESYNDYILHSIGNGILTINLDSEITVMNPEAARILKISTSESLSKKWTSIIDDKHPFHHILKKMLHDDQQPHMTEEKLEFEESSITVGIQVSSLLDAEQRIIGTNFVLSDLTELRKLQENIKEKERLAYLGEFSATVAHEIRNPLNSIELFIGLLKRHTAPDSGQLRNIHNIQKEIHALNAIVTDFLKFARQPKLQRMSFYVSKLFQEALLLAEKELKDKNISVHMNVNDKNLLLSGDFNQLRQALLNIFLNALQAMDNNGKLSLFASVNNDHDRISIEIMDDGKGIAQHDLKKIFEPFYSTRSQGTGLGLAIVRNIIESHNGTIFVESKIDVGTTVSIELPLE